MLHRSKFFDNFGQFISKFPNVKLDDFMSKGQIESKRWLVDELIKLDLNLGVVFVCAGWYGSLATFMFEASLKIDKIRSFDIDPTCANIADTFNRSWVMDGWKFKASTLDIMDMEYPTVYTTYRANGTSLDLTEMPNTIVNTSCEHIKNFEQWYSNILDGTLVILQSNNYYEITEHVNCINNINEFSKMASMTNLLYYGELDLPKYTRFMLIGYK